MDKLERLYYYGCPSLIVRQSDRRMSGSFTFGEDLTSKSNHTIEPKLISDDLFQKTRLCRRAKQTPPPPPHQKTGLRTENCELMTVYLIELTVLNELSAPNNSIVIFACFNRVVSGNLEEDVQTNFAES
ncbi:hypothetical protein [Dehalogenimonas formicexedens]|uniref:hypothetical protein n=1 Tax=Dehalogenimonas formicexedens TaxID=1839801 RepID=UPI0011AB326C|nr:hypothetical protein [Dehalogenimonas formicexedens]